jgi:hypothetical protein
LYGVLLALALSPAAPGAELTAEARASDLIPADAGQVQRLIDQLGHEKFAEREAAARTLLAVGLPAFGPLKEAGRHADPEVRFRAAKILAELRQRDFQRRLQAFSANLESSEEYELPGWHEFRRLVGDTRDTRDLFVKMQTDDPRLMQSLEDGPRAAGEMLDFRALQLLQPFGDQPAAEITLGSAAAFLFVAGRSDVPLSDFGAGGVYRLCVDEAVRSAVSGGPYQEPLRQMLSTWIVRESSANMEYQKLLLAMQYDLKAGLAPAVQVLEQAGHPPHLRQQAMVAVAKFGDASHIALLEQSLTDETPYPPRQLERNKGVQTEMRDVALAALVALTKQRFQDYGMAHVTSAPSFVFLPQSCGFDSPAERQKALDKWRAYRAAQNAKKS